MAARIPARWSLRTMLAAISTGTSRSSMMIGTSTWPRMSSVSWWRSLASDRIIPSTRRAWKNLMCAVSRPASFSEFISSIE